MRGIIVAIVQGIISSIFGIFQRDKAERVESENASLKGRAASIEASHTFESNLKDAQAHTSAKEDQLSAEKNKIRDNKGLEKDVLGSKTWVVFLCIILIIMPGCEVGKRYAYVSDRYPVINAPEKPNLDNIEINWAEFNPETTALFRQLLDNFAKVKKYAKQQEIAIKLYNLQARIHNLASEAALGMVPDKDAKTQIELLTKELNDLLGGS